MSPLSVPPVVMAGLAFYVGHYHLLIYVRRPHQRENLFLALLSWAACAYDVLCAGLYGAGSVSEGVGWQRGQFIALACITTFFLWFAAEYTALKRRLVVHLFSIFFAVALLVQLFDRSTFTWIAAAPSIKAIDLPFGLSVTYHEATLGTFSAIQGLAGLAAVTYIFVLAIRHYRQGLRAKAGPLLIAMVLVYAASINDTAVSQNVYQFIYLVEFSYMTLIMFLSYTLSRVVVTGAIAEERLRALVETTSDWVWEVDQDLAYTYCSPKVKAMLGYEPRELIGRTVFHLMPPEEARRLQPQIHEHVSRGMPLVRLQNTALARNGRSVLLETSAEPFHDARGNLLGYRGIDRDVTERERAEVERRESEALFRTLVENSPAGIFLVDDAFHFRYANDVICRILDYAPDELVGMDFRDVLDDESRDLVAERYRRRQNGEPVPSSYDIDIRRRDGVRRRATLFATTVRSPDGRTRTMGQLLDITDQRRTAEALQRAHEVVLNSPVVLFRWRAAPGWPVELVSENVVRFGYDPQELLDGTIPFGAMLHPEDGRRVADEVTRHTADGRTGFQQEYRLVTRSGETRWIDDRTVVERDAAGNATHYQGVLVDITERKLLEQEIRQLNVELEQRVRERTAELEAVNRELEAFAYSVSHDLRAPLRAMDGFSRALEEDCAHLLDEAGRGYVNHVRAGARRMGDLIDGLLDLSRISRGEMHRQPTDLGAMAREIVEALTRRDPGRRVEFQIADGLEAHCDPQLLRAALENLLENAWKFSARRSPALIEFDREATGESRAFFVRDNGAGFDMNYAGKLFQAFQRLHQTEEFPGIGLGLANVQRIIHRHGGRVWAEGSPDAGATFWFTLPESPIA